MTPTTKQDNVGASRGAVRDIGDETENLMDDSEILFEKEGAENGPYYICLRLDTASESLGLSDTACVNRLRPSYWGMWRNTLQSSKSLQDKVA